MGLSSYEQPLDQFEIAGPDRVFYPGKATILKGGQVAVSAPQVKEPKAGRYGWSNYLKGTLYNTFGLPASSFRTDNWED